MKTLRILAIVLILAGVLGLTCGNFIFTKKSHKTMIGTIELVANEKQVIELNDKNIQK